MSTCETAAAPANPDDIVSLMRIADLLHQDAVSESSLAFAERLQLEEALRLSIAESDIEDDATLIYAASDAGSEAEEDALALELGSRACREQAELTALQFWVADLDAKEAKDRELARQMQQLDDDGYDVDMALKKLGEDSVVNEKWSGSGNVWSSIESYLAALAMSQYESSMAAAADESPAPAYKSKGKGKMPMMQEDDDAELSLFDDPSMLFAYLPEFSSEFRKCGICFDIFNLHPLAAASSSSTAGSAGMFLPCGHGYCNTCISEHVRVQIDQPGSIFPPTCPQIECSVIVEKRLIASVMTDKDEKRWFERSRESQIKFKVYCPNKRCSALLDGDLLAKDALGMSKCTYCQHSLCKSCQVAFHKGLTCAQYQALPAGERDIEDRQAIQLAERKNWRRCPKCRVIVELEHGCNHILCTCGTHFCYKCGGAWDIKNVRCAVGTCQLWEEEMLLREQERRRAHYVVQPLPQPAPVPAPVPAPAPARVIAAHYQNNPEEHEHQVGYLEAIQHRAGYNAENFQYDVPLQGRNMRDIKLDEIEMWMTQFERYCPHQGEVIACQKSAPRWFDRMMDTFACVYCNRVFNSLNGLEQHLKTTSTHDVYLCCGRLFFSDEAMDKHQASSRRCEGTPYPHMAVAL